MIRPLIAAAVLTGWARPLPAQISRLDARLQPNTAHDVRALVDSARAAGLPEEPLVLKALEGQSKGASGDRIVVAVRALLQSLRTAQTSLGLQASPEELVAGSAALRAGAPETALASVRHDRGGSVAITLSVLADLVGSGIPVGTATKAILTLVHQNVSDREFLQLRTRVEQDIRTGMAPGSALERRLAGIPAAGPPRQP